MRTVLATVVTTGLVLSTPFLAAQQEMTLRGEIIDSTCYRKLGFEKGTGAGHLSCAMDCAKKGQVLGILTDGEGQLKITGDYAANNNAKLIGYVGKQVEVKGTRDRHTDYSTAIRVTSITLVKQAR